MKCFALNENDKFGGQVRCQASILSHPVLTDKIKCGLCVPRKFNTHKDVIGEVTKAIL